MRCFVALSLPDDTLDALVSLQDQLPSGRRVPRENLHLTLAFLDDQPDEALELLHEELERLRASAFAVELRGLGCYGGKKPRLIFAEAVPQTALDRLHQQVLGAARRAGITVARRRFHPHVTLVRIPPGAADADRISATIATRHDLRFPEIPVRAFSLFRSILHPAGPVYHELARYDLT